LESSPGWVTEARRIVRRRWPLTTSAQTDVGGDLGFGELYTLAEALEWQSAEPFAPDWVPFGDNHTGTFWLCARSPLGTSWFTSWDHDGSVDIGEPVLDDLGAFLREEYQQRLLHRPGCKDVLMLLAIPESARARTILEVKALLGVDMAEVVKRLRLLPVALPINDVIDAKAVMERLRTAGVACHLKLDFF
jgi:hypothetical protein